MHLYLLFLVVAAVTVLSPGPGVVMTLTNALRFGVRGTFGGILGIAFGALIVAAISATSVGVLLATSAVAFTTLKLLGAAYLIYLGIKLWRSPGINIIEQTAQDTSFSKRFIEGPSLQLTNPKAVFFFISIFPQFIDLQSNYSVQFSILVATYIVLVLGIHSLYALFAKRAKQWFTSERGGRVLNKTASATFVAFGVALASAQK
ncbi:LysE family translocator [Pseudomonas leptonychotis]|uniref:LysE family translocator n=1 Tax=Pseudomonas leptonychotis TaxID=2448482 RepID=UPI0038705C6D